jgi:hypothetical protein
MVEMPYCLINAFPEPRPRASAFQLSAFLFSFSLQLSAFLQPLPGLWGEIVWVRM